VFDGGKIGLDLRSLFLGLGFREEGGGWLKWYILLYKIWLEDGLAGTLTEGLLRELG